MKIEKIFLTVIFSLFFFLLGFFLLEKNLFIFQQSTKKINPSQEEKETNFQTKLEADLPLRRGSFLKRWEEIKTTLNFAPEKTKIHPEEKRIFNFFMKVIGKERIFGNYYSPSTFNYGLRPNTIRYQDDLSLNLKFKNQEKWTDQEKENFFLFKLLAGFIVKTYERIIKPTRKINEKIEKWKKEPVFPEAYHLIYHKIGYGYKFGWCDEKNWLDNFWRESYQKLPVLKDHDKCYVLRIFYDNEEEKVWKKNNLENLYYKNNEKLVKAIWNQPNVGFSLTYPKDALTDWIKNQGKWWLTNENSATIESFFIFWISYIHYQNLNNDFFENLNSYYHNPLKKERLKHFNLIEKRKFNFLVQTLEDNIINHQGDVNSEELKTLKKAYMKSDFFYMQKFLKFFLTNGKAMINKKMKTNKIRWATWWLKNIRYKKFPWARRKAYYSFFEHWPSKVFMGLLLFNKLSEEEIFTKGEKWKIAFANLAKKKSNKKDLKQEWMISSNFASLDTSKIKIKEEEKEIFTQFIQLIKDQKTGYPIPLELEFNLRRSLYGLKNDEMWEKEKNQYQNHLSLAIFALKNGKIVWNNRQKETFFHFKMWADFIYYNHKLKNCGNFNNLLIGEDKKERKNNQQEKNFLLITSKYPTNDCLNKWKKTFSDNFTTNINHKINWLFRKIIIFLQGKKIYKKNEEILPIIKKEETFFKEVISLYKEKLSHNRWDPYQKKWVPRILKYNSREDKMKKLKRSLREKKLFFLKPLVFMWIWMIKDEIYQNEGIYIIYGLQIFKKMGMAKMKEELIKIQNNLKIIEVAKEKNPKISLFSPENKNYFWISLTIAIGVIIFIIINFLFWNLIKKRIK